MAAIGFAAPWVLRRAVNAYALARSHALGINNINLSHYKFLRSFPLTHPLTSQASEICHLAQAIKGGEKSAIEEVKHILEMARRASSRREVLHTNFLTPPVVKESMQALEKLADIRAVAQGGYPQAERCRISVGHPDLLTSDPDVVAALSVTGNFGFQPCSHGDFLGAILNKGIAREKLGDIILQVGNVPVSCTKIPLISLDYEPPRTQTFKAIEASLRVDALASAGFKISRSKLVDSISKGEVRINWNPISKNNTTLKTDDMVSVSGRGRLKIGEIRSTRKGKFEVELIRYL
uniref:RNA-binding S4 domain-containing protein n=1 Tax=Fagus sylvatica TaxID=28930 RepID=A0A2N9F5U2_FAGSY